MIIIICIGVVGLGLILYGIFNPPKDSFWNTKNDAIQWKKDK